MKNTFVLLRRIFGILLSMLLLLSTGVACIPAAAEETPDVSVKVFQTTSRYDMGLDHQNVRLGWSITDTRRGMYQSAYHATVTAEDGTVAWDSGWVESGAQVGILVPDLQPETVYTARVRVKDEKGTSFCTFRTSLVKISEVSVISAK
jgi:hypothetical protein